MKIVLAGSPEISISAFKEVINNFDVVAIVTQPDRKKGRGMIVTETPAAILGKENKIKVFKPKKIGDIFNELKELDYDLLLSFAFGQYIPSNILSLGRYKPLNVHGSLLPKYRGAAPIHYAILNGDKKIGITLIEMIDKMDAGNMYFKASKNIDDKTTTGEGFNIISKLAKQNIVDWLKKIEKGNVKPEKQNSDFTLSPKIQKEEGKIDNNTNFKTFDRKVRGLNPFPGCYAFIENKRVKIFDYSTTEIKNGVLLRLKDKEVFLTKYQFDSKKIVNLVK